MELFNLMQIIEENYKGKNFKADLLDFLMEDISEDKLKSALYDFADSNHITIPDENGLDITDLDEDRGL